MLQKVTMIGYLGGDPEQRNTPSGSKVANFSLATNRKWKNDQGAQQEETTWFRISAWERQAEIVMQYLGKGSKVYIEGRLSPDTETGGPKIWTRNDGTPSAFYEVTANKILFLDKKGQDDYNPGQDIPI